MPPVLALDDLTIALPSSGERRFAVRGVSFAVEPGEILCLVGESGSGKSVIAQAAFGLLPAGLKAVGGALRLEGEDILRAGEPRLRQLRGSRASMIFQEPMTALNPVMRCGAQVDEVLRTHTALGEDERRKRVLAMLARVRIADPERVFAAYPHQLSGGQRQRIMIAMALLLEPALLVADEPTTALDVTTQAQILSLIRDLQRERGTGVLFITHDFGVVSEIADRVAVLQLGELVEIAPMAQVLRQPRHAYTRALIAAVPSLTPRERPPPPRAPLVLRTHDLGKVYDAGGLFSARKSVLAAQGVSIELRRGQALGIVGESGSGKSTVARCVARLIDPSSGEIWLGEDEIARLNPRQLRRHRHRVQIVFQDPYRSLNPRRTAGQSIIEGPMNFGLPRHDALARARELLHLVRLDSRALDRYPHQFSGGQRQRLCIARALAMEPELLIADEAVSALDVSVQAQVLRLLEDIRARLDLSILFITHDLRVAAQVCDSVAVMEHGRIVESGPLGAVYAAPRHDYTRALLAAAPGRHWNFAVPAKPSP